MGQFNQEVCSKALIAIRSRAERLDGDQIVDSFSSVGPLADLISSEDHQVIFGRRGTGKTHALRYLYSNVNDCGDIGVYVDMLNLGSDTSIYNDQSLTVAERATRLLIDTLAHIQEGFLDHATSGVDLKFEELSGLLDNLNEATSNVRVNGDMVVTSETTRAEGSLKEIEAKAEGTNSGLLPLFAFRGKKTHEANRRSSSSVQGRPAYIARFPQLGAAIRDLVQFFPNTRVWIIFDEWSSIPMELQPFLADILKRTFFNIQKVTVKIGAVEHRTRFLLEQGANDQIGLEPTADIRTDVRLDDFLLFDNDRDAAVIFFKDFLFKHIKGICKNKQLPEPTSVDQLISVGFSQKNAFEEFVKAAEGVPRDAIHIASNCAQKAFGKAVDVPTVRQAAHRYFQEDKSSQVDDNPALRELLKFIVDSAIRKKRTNSFLLEFGVRDRNVDLLFDRRLIHIRRRNVSSRDNPGARYYHYKIDYGCYVDLASTKQMPDEYDFASDIPIEDIVATIVVPTDDDARSYRRSILDLESFYETFPDFATSNQNLPAMAVSDQFIGESMPTT